MFGGQVAKNVTFFVETDSPNLGKTLADGKNIQPAMILQDAYAEFKVTDAFAVDAGLMFIPFSRNFLQSAASLLPIDYGAYTYTQSGPTESSTGRDTGFQAKGYLLNDHLEYRIGAFQGARDTASHRAFRYAGRVQYNLLDPEVGFFYTGSYLGKKKIVSVGGAFDRPERLSRLRRRRLRRPSARLRSADRAVRLQLVRRRRDAAGAARAARRALRARLSDRRGQADAVRADGAPQRRLRPVPADETRTSIGVSYWWAGHNANIKAAYGRIAPTGAAVQNDVHDSASGVLFLR